MAPEQRLGVLVAVEDDQAGGAEPRAAGDGGDDLPPQCRIGRQQPEGDQAMRFAAAHGLRQIERAILGLPGQAVEPPADQKFEA